MRIQILVIFLLLSYISNAQQFFIPNAFTPDGDKLNDYFIVQCFEKDSIESFSIKIFSQSGEQIFASNNIDEPWLGGDEYYSQSSLFHYQIRILKADSRDPVIIVGHLCLIR